MNNSLSHDNAACMRDEIIKKIECLETAVKSLEVMVRDNRRALMDLTNAITLAGLGRPAGFRMADKPPSTTMPGFMKDE